MLERKGIPFENINSHSNRKGSATNAASGSTHAPPIVAICLRAGWALAGVLDRYLSLENAGDQFVGRVAAGLPLLTKEFAVLPPRFRRNLTADQKLLKEQFFKAVFPNDAMYGPHMKPVLMHLFASLCYHKEFLQGLPPQHPWHATPLALDPQNFQQLHDMVELKYGGDRPDCIATGVPPYTLLAKRLAAVEDLVKALPGIIKEQTSQLLDEKGVAAGNVTAAYLNESIQRAMRDVLTQFNGAPAPAAPPVAPVAPRVYMWGGALHRLPENYILTKRGTAAEPRQMRTPQQAYLRWHLSDRANGVPPLKKTKPHDYSIRAQRKRFSDWKILCETLDALLPPELRAPTTAQGCAQSFTAAYKCHCHLVKTLHAKKNKRDRVMGRCSTTVSTVVSEMVHIKKQIKKLRAMIILKVFVLKWEKKRNERNESTGDESTDVVQE